MIFFIKKLVSLIVGMRTNRGTTMYTRLFFNHQQLILNKFKENPIKICSPPIYTSFVIFNVQISQSFQMY